MHSDKIKMKKQPSYKLVKKNRQLAAFKKKGLNKSRSMENIHLNYYEDRKRSPSPTVRMPRDIFDDISEKFDEESSGEYAR